MSRTSCLLRHLRPLALAAALIAAGSALADGRPFPADAKRGRMSHLSGHAVALDGRTVLLAAGTQIRSADNLIIVPTALPPEAEVRYQMDADGQIRRVWVLTPAEAAAK